MNLVCVSGMADASASGGAGQVPTQRGERERSPTRTPTTQEQQQRAQGPQRFRMNSPEGGQGLPGGATAPYASIPPPPPKAASGCGSMPGSPTGQQEVFSTAQMTQIAQIVSLSLNQAMGEFNMRLNGLQQQVVHQQNVFAQAQVQQAASQPAQVPVAKTSPSISSGLSSFGDRPPTSPQPNFPRNTVEQPPGLQQSPQRLISEVRQGQGTAQNTQGEASSQDDRDVFTKSEKWLPPLPKCEHGTWKTREQEILGFAGYVQSLRSWVALASDTFGWELESALSWPHELHMTNLKPAQQLRSARLLAILTQAFAEYPRAHMILQAYSEGIGMDGSFQAVRGTSGFEALRLLAKEFSSRSRAEAAFFRSEFMSKTFKAQSGPTQISDLVRQMDVGLSKYRKLIDTLPQHCDKTGLDLQQVYLTLMLLRSLPSDVKNYVVLHASGEGYTDYRSAALKFEQQQRLFQELGGGSGRNMHALEAEGDWSTYYGYEDEQDYYTEGAEEEWEWDPESELWLNTAAINKNSGVKCRKCGKTGHMQKDCSTNMGRVKCFKCGQSGHIGANCQASSPKSASSSPSSSTGKGSGAAKAKPAAKAGRGKGGRKGKMHEVSAEGPQEEEQESGEAIMMPLISSQVSSSEGTWWLLDSGAATSVLSQNYEGMYRCQAQEDSAGALETYYAANGTPVHMRANVLVSLAFHVVTGASGKKKTQSFKLACCIGDVSHNIISTTQLVKKGWSVIQSPGETYLYHEDSGTLISDVLLWGGTPWLRACRAAQPSLKDGSQPMELVESSVVEPEGLKVSMVGAVELSSQEKLRQHVLRGHYPFDPHCLECQQGRGVSRAPRRSLRERILEVQVDFFFLGLVESKFKMILLRQVFSGLLGVTAVSENVQVTGQHLRQILAEFGLLETLEGPPVDFRTDAQDEVGTVLRRSGLPREYTVNKAGPQNHDTVGSVERGVREVKEALAVLRLELAKAGLDLVDSLVAWEAASRYVTAMHNLHGKIQNTGKTGKELLRNTSEGTRISAMFCSRVLAETPESVDSIGRFVTAAYLYPVRNSFAHFVCAKIADELKFFQAKSLKLVFPIEYPQDLIERFVCHSGSGDHPSLVDQAPIEILPEDFARLPDQVQPPRHWVDAHGRTEGCSSCATRQGRHSKKCCERYWNWIRNQKKGEVPALPDKPEEQLPIVEPNDPAVAVPSRPLPRIPGLPAGMIPTRRCPSCESGMNAPGTRHSAECRKRQAEFVSGETAKPSLGDLEDLPVQEGGVRDGSYSPSLAPDPVESADVEMATEDVDDMPMVDVCMAQPYHVGMLTSPELVQRDRFSVESIQYDGYCDEFVVMDFCGQKIKLWKPSGAVSDVTLRDLPAEGTFLAMQKEIRGLTAVGAGQVLAENVARESGQRIIGTRWVTNEKEEAQEGVRARIVAKDFASGQSARSMGISSPTPSIEALRMVLGVACGAWSVGNQAMFLAGLDVSQAFMNSPLERPEILRMPLSMSTMKGEPIFLWAEKGINGLRIASQAWIVFFSSIVKSIGVVSGTVEPCLYVGRMVGKDQATIVIMAYVDDLLVATTSESALKTLMTALSAHVKVRETGRVGLKGGHLRFLGRSIFRRPGSSALYMQVDPTYLDEAFAEFDLKKGSTTFPDLRPILEQEGSQPLSAEGHARFRRVLGRLSWYCQTRQDLLILVSMLGTGQAQPFETHEKCLRAVLRYLMSDMDVALRFPSEELALPDVKGLEVYTDAGFAPMKSTGRRSVSGTCFIFQQCLMKCFSRHQSAVTLSSCEAELVALQSGVQEGIGLLRTLGFVLGRLYPWVDIIPQDAQVTWYDEAESDDEDSMKVSYLFPLVVKTDSLSGKMLLEASDLQRKSRHIEIKVYWLRELMDRKVLLLSHVPGTLNPADCFTKCLPTQKFLFYRNMLGFVKVDFSLISNILGFCLKVCDNSYSKPISCLSNRNCVLCGERLISFVLEEELQVSGDQRSFRHVKAVFAQETLTNPDSLHLAIAPMAGEEEDSKSMVSGLTRVDWTTGNPRTDPETGEVMRRDERVMEVTEAAPEGAAASGTQEPREPVSGTPDTKEAAAGAPVAEESKPSGGPSSGSKRPQVKKMPKRPAAKLMPRRLKVTKVKLEPGTAAKVPGKNRFKNKETKRRQKATWEEIKKAAREERAQPAPAFEIPARGGDVPVRSFFDPVSGRRETMEVKPLEREQKFRTVQTGFSRYPTETRTCYQCGEKGHLSANCPQKMRRVSLTEGVIKYEGAGETRPRVRLQGNMGSIPQETPEFDDVRPEDSASQVGGQYLEICLRLEEVSRRACHHHHLHLRWVEAQRLPGADQVFRRRLQQLCGHHQRQVRDFRLSFLRTHLWEKLT